jgi:hypothetical protein
MAVLFISHSSKDGAVTTALEAWLRTNGFRDVFVDYSIAGGDAWDEALKSAAGNCRVILCIVTESWLNSNECFGEFQAGFYMGKRIIPLFLLSGGHDRSDEAKSGSPGSARIIKASISLPALRPVARSTSVPTRESPSAWQQDCAKRAHSVAWDSTPRRSRST